MIKSDLQPSKLQYAGEGVVYLSEDPIELTNRLQLLIAEYKAGNTTTRNGIVAITDELRRKDIIDSEQYKALNYCLFLQNIICYIIYNDYQAQNKTKICTWWIRNL